MNSQAFLNQNLLKKDIENKNMNEQLRKLSSLLHYCNYNYNAQVQVTKNLQELLRAFPLVRLELLQFYQNNQLKKYIEIVCYVEKLYFPTVTLFAMLPQRFSEDPPFVRIINPNPSVYAIKKAFVGLKSVNDPNSIILNSALQSILQWQNHKSLTKTILQAQHFIKLYVPFERKDQATQNYPVWGAYKADINNYNNFNANPNDNPNNAINYNNNISNNNINNNLNNGLSNSKNKIFIYNAKPIYMPINSDSIVKGQIYYTNNIQRTKKTKILHDRCLQNNQILDATKNALNSESQFLRAENNKLNYIIGQQSQTNMLSLIKPADRFSQALLDLLSSIKARENTAIFIQQKFIAQEKSFDSFMKILKKNEQNKFEQIYLVKKYLQYAQQQTRYRR